MPVAETKAAICCLLIVSTDCPVAKNCLRSVSNRAAGSCSFIICNASTCIPNCCANVAEFLAAVSKLSNPSTTPITFLTVKPS